MIIKVNNKGISIDVSMSEALTEKFGTTNATIPINFISKFKIKLGEPSLVQLVDRDEDDYSIHYSVVSSINGESGFTNNLEVYNKIKEYLFEL